MSSTKQPEVYINLYIGTPENEHGDYLFADLISQNPYREVTLESTDCISDMSESEFLEKVDCCIYEAAVWAKALGIPVKVEIDELIESLGGDESSPESIKQLRRMIRELKEAIR